MNGRTRRGAIRLGIAQALVVTLAVACGGTAAPSVPGNKEGGAGQNRLSLTMITGESNAEEANAFATAVRDVANGTVEVKVENATFTGTGPTYETKVLEYVRDGKAELGWVASRAFDTIGVESFSALQAPFLIDSYSLEAAVLSSDVGRKMLDGPRSAGLVGIGYLQGPMRRPLGITHGLVSLDDFKNATIGIRASKLVEQSLTALGAKPKAFVPGNTAGLDGMEAHLGIIQDANYDEGATSLTGNVVLWPRTGVFFANAKTFDALSTEQQSVLRRAADRAFRTSVEQVPLNGERHLQNLCNGGLKIVAAPAEDRAALRRAVQPVYDTLNGDATTKAAIDAIEGLRSTTGSDDAVVACGDLAAGPSPSIAAVKSAIDGTWSVCFDREEYLAADPDAGEVNEPSNVGCGAKVFRLGQFYELAKDGTFDPRDPGGPFWVDKATSTVRLWSEHDSEMWEFKYSLYQETLTFQRSGPLGPTGFVVKPFHRVADVQAGQQPQMP